MAYMKRNVKVKAGMAAMALVLCGSNVIGSVCNVPAPATVRAAEEGTEGQAEKKEVLQTAHTISVLILE